ncbi:MAG: hypothetical protein DSY81_10860 [Bacillota bacterium]|nr:MAG: hypothetical protein DSY81_10860 [Bacillota bacterium]
MLSLPRYEPTMRIWRTVLRVPSRMEPSPLPEVKVNGTVQHPDIDILAPNHRFGTRSVKAAVAATRWRVYTGAESSDPPEQGA